ncbi:MAG: hypothetical protein FWC23_02420 [Chitinispirillia bacterium]|nr:hypothetical protein [Chitinispirillia bacterium]
MKIVKITLAAAVLLSVEPLSAQIPDTKWYDRSKETFTINTASELAGLAKLVNKDSVLFRWKVINLGRDIVINDTANWREWGSNPPALKWTAIGTDSKRFQGTFNGNGYTVSGVYIKTEEGGQGLFGVIGYHGTVKKLSVTASYVEGKKYAGILAGGSFGWIKECRVYGIAVGDSIVGGLVGVNDGMLKSSSASGSVKGRINVGGLMGASRGGAALGSHSSAAVSGDTVSGGFIGANWGGMIRGNFSTGKVSGGADAGGFAGRSYGGFMRDNYYDRKASGQVDTGKGEGMAASKMRSRKFVNNLNVIAGLSSANMWVRSRKKYPAISDSPAANAGGYFAGGNGSEGGPYIILTKKQLEDFSMLVNSGERFSGRHIKLAQNIALNDTTGWQNWADDPPAHIWVPAGILVSPFNGTFDGGGHAVSGVYVNNPRGSFVGLFGVISNGAVIKNLGVSASYIRGLGAVGGLVGGNGSSIYSGGNITGCYSAATVAGTGYNIGGLAGRNDSGTINRCYASGAVSGGSIVGGLVGDNGRNGVIRNSYSTGPVTGDSIIGGLAGFHSEQAAVIQNSYTISTITGDRYAGGLVGWTDCHCGQCHIGAVLNSFFESRAGALKKRCGGRYGVDAGLMTKRKSFNGWDFGRVWGIDSTVNGGYPYLLDDSTAGAVFLEGTGWYTANPDTAFFTISTAGELAVLAGIVNGEFVADGIPKDNFSGKTVELANSIDLSRYDNWVPIGGTADEINYNSFSGTFDGGLYVISNLTIDRSRGRGGQGLFGAISGGAVINLGVENVNIRAKESAGGIAGIITDTGSIFNCYTIGKITGKETVGGLVGRVLRGSRVTNSYSIAAVNASDARAGGLAGIVDNGFIYYSYSAGPVQGKGVLGGLIGLVLDYGHSVVAGCYSVGAVVCTDNGRYIGGLIGYAGDKSRVSNCAALGSEVKGCRDMGRRVAVFGGDRYGGSASNNAAWDGMRNKDGKAEWPDKGAAKDNGEDITLGDLMSDPTIGGRFTSENGWTLEAGKLPGLRGKAVNIPEYIFTAPIFSSANTAWYTKNPDADTFTISTPGELAGLSVIVNGMWKGEPQRESFSGKTIVLAGSIDLSEYDNWVPIGNRAAGTRNRFSGVFDGRGHIISRLTINRPDTNYQGLFGGIDSGRVENLGLDSVKIRGSRSVGGIAGYMRNSRIINSRSAGEVAGANRVGGVVGEGSQISVSGSYFKGTVSGDNSIGGVAGLIWANSRLADCYSEGAVSGGKEVGGVVGAADDSEVVNCTSRSDIAENLKKDDSLKGGLKKNDSLKLKGGKK